VRAAAVNNAIMVLRNMGNTPSDATSVHLTENRVGIALSEIGARFAVTTKMKFRKLNSF
jgi:hypothetical protein